MLAAISRSDSAVVCGTGSNETVVKSAVAKAASTFVHGGVGVQHADASEKNRNNVIAWCLRQRAGTGRDQVNTMNR
jgi:hypothetical protein